VRIFAFPYKHGTLGHEGNNKDKENGQRKEVVVKIPAVFGFDSIPFSMKKKLARRCVLERANTPPKYPSMRRFQDVWMRGDVVADAPLKLASRSKSLNACAASFMSSMGRVLCPWRVSAVSCFFSRVEALTPIAPALRTALGVLKPSAHWSCGCGTMLG
jgi:hypothetical protein